MEGKETNQVNSNLSPSNEQSPLLAARRIEDQFSVSGSLVKGMTAIAAIEDDAVFARELADLQDTVGPICPMLQNMGSADWAAFPAGTTLELKDPATSGDHSPPARRYACRSTIQRGSHNDPLGKRLLARGGEEAVDVRLSDTVVGGVTFALDGVVLFCATGFGDQIDPGILG